MDKEDKPIIKTQDHGDRWIEHSEELLNRSVPPSLQRRRIHHQDTIERSEKMWKLGNRGTKQLSVPRNVSSRLLLNQMEDSADAQLQDQLPGFRKDRSCIDQIETRTIVVEQSIG